MANPVPDRRWWAIYFDGGFGHGQNAAEWISRIEQHENRVSPDGHETGSLFLGRARLEVTDLTFQRIHLTSKDT